MSTSKTKRCPGCKQEFSLDAFCKNRSKKDGLGIHCKKCKKQYARKHYVKYRDKVLRRKREYCKTKWGEEVIRRSRFKCVYGLTLKQHEQLYLDQNGRCGLCSESVAYDKTYTDHDHKTGKVRALLCIRCNTGLGMFKDTVEGLQRAINYLRRF